MMRLEIKGIHVTERDTQLTNYIHLTKIICSQIF